MLRTHAERCNELNKLHCSLMARPSRQGGEQDAAAMHLEMATLGMVGVLHLATPSGHSVRKACVSRTQ